MTSRFPAMISIINTTVKTGYQYCDIPVNKLCLNTLRLLRNHGYIWGFSVTSPRKRVAKLYPRVKIYFKYSHKNCPALKGMRIYKNTTSNFFLLKHIKIYQAIAKNKLFIITTKTGLTITSLDHLLPKLTAKTTKPFSGKILAEILI